MATPFIDRNFRLGILGGGQLGKMLCQATSRWDIHTSVLDASPDFPAATVCTEFVEGDFRKHANALAFGKKMDAVTIEIESVNSRALHDLKALGKVVHPEPEALDIIKDKGLQKQFYADNGLPTAPFKTFADKAAIASKVDSGELRFPFVVKARRDGYDGRGVAIIRSNDDLESCFDSPSIVEPALDIELEISVVVARNPSGNVRSFPVVGMHFHPTANLVEYLFCPVGIGPALEQEAVQIAHAAIEDLDICGLLAVEMFVTTDGDVLINEVAPRPHNSGHHTIEACNVSQFEQHIRGILDMPLVDPKLRAPAVMVNILGSDGHTGPAKYEGMRKVLAMDDVHVHVYGKEETRPFRKMGHATIIAPTLEGAVERGKLVSDLIKATA